MLSRISIRLKIFFPFFLLVVSISAAFTTSSYLRITNTMNKEIHKHGIDVVKTFSQLAAPYIFEYDYVTIRDIAFDLIEESDLKFISITDTDGKVWLSTDKNQRKISLNDQFYNSVIKNQATSYRQKSRKEKESVEFVSPISALDKVSYLIITEIPLDNIRYETSKRIKEAILICICLIIASSLIVFYLSKLLTEPLKELVQGTNEISTGNFSYKIKKITPDEIGNLSQSFNTMTAQLEKESLKRGRAEKKLIDHRNKLEEIVLERTRELTISNQQLSEEIKQRTRTEIALKKSEERYKRLSEVTLEGIVLYDNNSIIDCNSSFERLFGYSSIELIGKKTLHNIIPLAHKNDTNNNDIIHEPYTETTVARKDGTTFPIRIQSLKISSATEDVWVSSILDITEQKKLEAQIRQTQKLESIGLMAGGVAHDLNNILTGITGYPELILKKLPADSDLRAPLGAVQEAGDRASAIVSDLLTVARGVASAREPYNLNTLILEYFNSPEFRQLHSLYPNVSVRHELSARQSTLLCSSVHMKKCLMNLVNNAAEAIDHTGQVIVSTWNHNVDNATTNKYGLDAGKYVALSIQDSGPGISNNDLEHIFEPFYSKKKMGRSGTGLGLTIVWNTAQDHEGKIFTESGEQGTCFTLFFPINNTKGVVEEKNGDKRDLAGLGKHILVVDDEPQPRDIACQMLEYHGYKVDSVCSGEQAVDYIKKTPVDLIVLDMMMDPGMNGCQTFEEIIKIFPNQKAIIASGYSGNTEVKSALEHGVRGFLKKPYSIDKLGQAVKQALYS